MSNVTATIAYDETTGEYDNITRVISGGRIYDMPTEWVNPDVEYVKCLSETYLDRNNDVYLPDVDVATDYAGEVINLDRPVWNDPANKTYADLVGYTMVPAADKIVRCWYCNHDFSYREFRGNSPAEQAFVLAMLVHYSEHKANGDLPFVTTYFPGKDVVRPDGSIAASKPGSVRTWVIKGALL